jgi:hypothetical protein
MNLELIERRLARMESRIVQIMMRLDIDPYERMYDKFEDRHKKEERHLQPEKKGDNIHT